MTQNQNEGFDAMIQNSIPNIPKSNYVSFLQLQTGINGTAVNFSFGRKAENLMFEKLNMIAGENCLKDCTKLKKKRLSGSAYGNLEKKKVQKIQALVKQNLRKVKVITKNKNVMKQVHSKN